MAPTRTLPDPFALSRKALDKWERVANDFAGKLMSQPEFSKGLNLSASQAMRLKAVIAHVMGQVLPVLNLPTRTDIIELREQLHGISTRLDLLADHIERGESTPARDRPVATLPGPTRTRKPSNSTAVKAPPAPVAAVPRKRRKA
jgi:hypothetical protein